MSARPTLAADDPRHGRASTYCNHRCRCGACRAAWSEHVAQQRAQRVAKGLAPDDPRHGKATTYGNWNCRCRACTDAWAAAARQRGRRRALERLTGRQVLVDGAP